MDFLNAWDSIPEELILSLLTPSSPITAIFVFLLWTVAGITSLHDTGFHRTHELLCLAG